MEKSSKLSSLLENFSLSDLPDDWHRHIWPLVLNNTDPPYYLIGGAITRTLINQLYGSKLPIENYDLPVGRLSDRPYFDSGWLLKKNTFGGWKLVNEDLHLSVDLWPFSGWQRSRLKVATFQDAIHAVPLDIQAVGFDIDAGKLVYHPQFVSAIENRCARTLCLDEHILCCETYKISREQEIKMRADRLGFRYEL